MLEFEGQLSIARQWRSYREVLTISDLNCLGKATNERKHGVPRRKHQHEYPNSCLQSEKEDADFELFAEAYLVATGFELEVEGSETGTQEFTCSGPMV